MRDNPVVLYDEVYVLREKSTNNYWYGVWVANGPPPTTYISSRAARCARNKVRERLQRHGQSIPELEIVKCKLTEVQVLNG